VIVYRATLDVPGELVWFAAKLLLAERRTRALGDLPAHPGPSHSSTGFQVPMSCWRAQSRGHLLSGPLLHSLR